MEKFYMLQIFPNLFLFLSFLICNNYYDYLKSADSFDFQAWNFDQFKDGQWEKAQQ